MTLSDAIQKVSKTLALLNVERAGQSASAGTAFVVSADGLLATAAHVLRDATKIEAKIVGLKSALPCAVVATDLASDIALLKADARDLAPAGLHRGAALPPGREVALLGFPHSDFFGDVLGNPLVMTMRGIIGNRYPLGAVEHYVIDVAADAGMSGGPVFLADGAQVIGVIGGRFDADRTRARMAGRPRDEVRTMPSQRSSILFAPSVEYLLALLPARR